jgi:predicted DNA-binding transcriptional regulator YafY
MKRVTIDYVNWKGERGLRLILPDTITFSSNKWHPTPQWLLRAFDVEKKAWRHFAMADIKNWRQDAETEEP